MFLDCTNLTTPPQLQATNLDMWCYSSMFGNCSSLTAVPTLSATTLADYCYFCMFYNCKSLSSAPYLSAQNLEDWCYNSMFYGCDNLTSISADFTSWSPSTATTNWVTDIDTKGNFYNDKVEQIYGVDNIPESWQPIPPIQTSALTYTAQTSGNIKFADLYNNMTFDSNEKLYYSRDGEEWQEYIIGEDIPVVSGDQVAFSGTLLRTCQGQDHSLNFQTDTMFTLSGNCNSLINWATELTLDWTFTDLFGRCSGLTSIDGLKLPATTISQKCYANMFGRCSNLCSIGTFVLPATVAPSCCYEAMFNGNEKMCDQNNNNLLIGIETFESTEAMHNFMYGWTNWGLTPLLNAVEVKFTEWPDFREGENTHYWFGNNNWQRITYFIKPEALPIVYSSATPNHCDAIPGQSIILYRDNNGDLYYAENITGHNAGDVFDGVDPFA